jgi:hypothetical protein
MKKLNQKQFDHRGKKIVAKQELGGRTRQPRTTGDHVWIWMWCPPQIIVGIIGCETGGGEELCVLVRMHALSNASAGARPCRPIQWPRGQRDREREHELRHSTVCG